MPQVYPNTLSGTTPRGPKGTGNGNLGLDPMCVLAKDWSQAGM